MIRQDAPGTMTIEQFLDEMRMPCLAWLAGYPRSGAALVRNILARCFGHVTMSRYPEQNCGQIHTDAVNGVNEDLTVDTLVQVAQQQGTMFFKTHEMAKPASSNRPTIVIVRDPRRVFGSLRSWYADTKQFSFSMRELITGRHRWGDWSQWITTWANYAPRADTLWLRYGDLCADPIKNGAERIAAMFNIPIIGTGVDDFRKLQEANPVVFRKRDLEGNGGMTPDEEKLCWELHGKVASMLGYYRG